MEFSLQIDSASFKKSLDETRDRYDQAFAVAKNMIASMMKTEVSADVDAAGNFNSADIVSVETNGEEITTKIDTPGAAIFETGGTIYGHPMLWLPLSGTDAEGVQASSYGDKLFSVNRKTGGVPLLFSVKDRAPKYFGVPNVNVPKKFHIAEIRARVGAQIPDIFEAAIRGVNA